MAPPEFHIAGVRIHAIRVADAVQTITDWIANGRRDFIVLTGAHGIVEMQSDRELRDINNAAGLTTPDGMPVVWVGRWKGHSNIEKVYAPDVMTETFADGVSKGYRHFLYGGEEGVALQLKSALEARYPGIVIAGTYCPPFRSLTPDERQNVVRLINETSPDIVWVGIGCPKQERWMHAFRPMLRAPVLVGVGAGFDFLSGRKPLAPRWIQRSGFEWLFRTFSEPRRLARRYVRVVPVFTYLAVREFFKPRAGHGGRNQ